MGGTVFFVVLAGGKGKKKGSFKLDVEGRRVMCVKGEGKEGISIFNRDVFSDVDGVFRVQMVVAVWTLSRDANYLSVFVSGILLSR